MWRAEAELLLGKTSYATGLALQADEALDDIEAFYRRRIDELSNRTNGGAWVKVRTGHACAMLGVCTNN